MSGDLRRRIERLDRAVGTTQDAVERRAEAAEQRIFEDRDTWSDHVFLSGHLVEGWQTQIASRVPCALIEPHLPHRRPGPSEWFFAPLVAVAATQELSAEQEAMIDEIDRRWSPRGDISERLRFAALRLALGVDRGKALRARCWRPRTATPQLTQWVLEQSHSTRLNHPHRQDTIGYAAVANLAGRVLDVDTQPELAELADRNEHWYPEQYFDVSLLEFAILASPEAEPSWLGHSGAAWIRGQIRSEPVNRRGRAAAIRELVASRAVERAVKRLACEENEPKLWRDDRWYAYKRAKARRMGGGA